MDKLFVTVAGRLYTVYPVEGRTPSAWYIDRHSIGCDGSYCEVSSVWPEQSPEEYGAVVHAYRLTLWPDPIEEMHRDYIGEDR